MNLEKLKNAESTFMERYPGGFEHPDMVEEGRKHRIGKLVARARDVFKRENFEQSEALSEQIIKTVTSSSMVSVFEKPKFRDFVRDLSAMKRARLCSHIYQLLHGDMEQGFNDLSDFLAEGKMAKWTLVTVFPYYMNPEQEAFVKPTTAKEIIRFYELEIPPYRARPYWDFYISFRDSLKEMMVQVHPLLGPDMAAFSAFLMMGSGAW